MNEEILKHIHAAVQRAKVEGIKATLTTLGDTVQAHDDELGTELEAAYRGATDLMAHFDTLLVVAEPGGHPFALRNRQLAAIGAVLARRLSGAAAEIVAEVDTIEKWCEETRNRIADRQAQDARHAAFARKQDAEAAADRLTPFEIVRDAEACGVALNVDDSGAIRVQPAHRLGSPHTDRIAHKRPQIIAYLQERQAVSNL